ncbi:MAG: tRNA epoxyqueuosine(34) reductase QueG [Rikenellaceae bacterium]
MSKEVGFDLCGVTSARYLADGDEALRRWLSDGYGEPLGYMQRNVALRSDPRRLVDGAKTVIVCAISYKNLYSLAPVEPKIASYAMCRDYHKSIKKRLKALLRALQQHHPSLEGRVFVDSAPLLEKRLAVEAGLGWIGRQSLLVTPEYGSFVLLGELVVTIEAEGYDRAFKGERCGDCRRCVERCPAGAINDNRTIDTRRCISCRTVEMTQDESALPLAGWIFGCDECQICCPHNAATPLSRNPDFVPIIAPPTREEWLGMSDEIFERDFATTPLKRRGRDCIIRSIIQ